MAQALAPESSEAKEAAARDTTGNDNNHYARAFRRLVKRRQAIRTATPFTAAIVAVAESWIYSAGVLCYLQERTTLRVLDLHGSANTETIVDVRGLLCEAEAELCHVRPRKSKLLLLHYAAGLVTCLYRRTGQSRLLVIHVAKRRLVSISPTLESTYKIFVRNDADFLYYGTHSEIGEDGFRRWVLMSYDIQGDKWLEHRIHLTDIVGSDIGQNICFEIIDGKFYGLSNQTSFEADELDWTSFYHCFRFSVRDPELINTERSDRERMWRRQHAEGPIDDRWSFLTLSKDEKTGNFQVLESRKEWLNQSSSGQRTYYTTDLHFAPLYVEEEYDDEDLDGATTPATESNTGSNSGTIDNDSGYSGSFASTSTIPDSSSNPPPSTSHIRTNYNLPWRTRVRPRCPHKTHTGDDASTALLFTFSKSPVRSYHACAQAFVDLVDDPAPTSLNTTRLRLRSGARRLRPGVEDDATLSREERTQLLYRNGGANEIAFWPPGPSLGTQNDAEKLEKLGCVVNPPSHSGPVTGVWDERSLVYSVGNSGGPQAVVFLSFDPAIQLRGLPRWDAQGDEPQQPVSEADKEEETASGAQEAAPSNVKCQYMQAACHYAGQDEEEYSSEPDCNGTDDKGKGEQTFLPACDESFGDTWGPPTVASGAASPQTTSGYSSMGDDEPPLDTTEPFSSGEQASDNRNKCIRKASNAKPETATSGRWTWIKPAMYREINFGFNSLPEFSQEKLREGSRSCGS